MTIPYLLKKTSMTVKISRHMDELDAASKAETFIERIYEENKDDNVIFEKQYHNLTAGLNGKVPVDGGIISLWKNDVVIATTQILRTNFNHSQLICVEIPKT
jgi:hypothetical protein